MTTITVPRPAQRIADVWIVVGALVAAAALGLAIAARPELVVALVVVAALAAGVMARPAAAAVAVIGLTPLIAGIDRGRIIPVLRPNEALVGLLLALVVGRAILVARAPWKLRIRLSRLEWALVAMAMANSVLPLAFMVLRGRSVEPDDISYALVLWKYLAVYALVRFTVRTQPEVMACLWASMISAALVGGIGIMQALDLLGVRGLLAGYYAPFGYTGILEVPRGGSTLALPAATADLMMINLALVVALALWRPRWRVAIAPLGLVYVFATFAAAEFSSILGLSVAAVATAYVVQRLDLLRFAPLALAPPVAVLWPVIMHRFQGFQSTSGLPDSWTTRWYNLTNFFWPDLSSGTNFLLGVRPAARAVAQHEGTGFVWIELGYMWLFWGGGVFLFVAFWVFIRVAARSMLRIGRSLSDPSSVAAVGAFSFVIALVPLMIFDPHLTYRGAADCLMALLALATVSARAPARPTPSLTGAEISGGVT